MRAVNRYKRCGWLRCAALLIPALAIVAQAATYYVSPTGSDNSNPGTSAAPFRTIQRGVNAASAGDTVLVEDGVYTCDPQWTTEVENYIFAVTKSGTAAQWITIKAQNKWGAQLSGDDNRCFQATYVEGNYVRIQGFDMYGFWNGGMGIFGDHNTVSDCHFHDMARECTDDAYGRGGAVGGSGFSNGIVERNLIHDNGRLHPEDGCTGLTTAYYANHDHAMYMGNFNGLIVRNNVFYNNPSGWFMHISNGDGMQILNNTFAFKNPNRDGHILLYDAAVNNSLIANNIFYQPGAFAVGFYNQPPSTIRIENNITDASEILGDDYGQPTGPSGVTTAGNIVGANVSLVNPSTRDFHLQTGSPAINAGQNFYSAGVVEDYAGTARPASGNFDLGAYEYAPGAIARFLPSALQNEGSIGVRQTGTSLIFSGLNRNAKTSVSIYSLDGSLETSFGSIHNNEIKWMPDKQKPGIYVVKVKSGNTMRTAKTFIWRAK